MHTVSVQGHAHRMQARATLEIDALLCAGAKMIPTTQEYRIGDCLDLMPEMDEDSVDLVVTDPPYGYSFMGKDWDKAVPTVDIWQECLRILKPGAFAFIMSAPRQDVLAHNLVNLSDAGFETGFTSIYWAYASGFPKAGNIGKMVDKRLGAEREVIGINPNGFAPTKSGNICNEGGAKIAHPPLTTPSSSQAKELDGSYGGFQPKPAVEVVMVVMKPLSEKSYVDQALVNQKGLTWLDDGRIPYQSDVDIDRSKNNFKPSSDYDAGNTNYKLGIAKTATHQNMNGRFPANLLVSDDVLNDGMQKRGGITDYQASSIYSNTLEREKRDVWIGDSGSFSRYFDLDAWWDAQIKHLPKEAQKTFPFLIIPKANKNEKNGSKHPTVKPVKLFSWLITIGSREGDMVLDLFLGSGTALEAGRLTNRNVTGLEIDPQWEPFYSERSMSHTPTLNSYF